MTIGSTVEPPATAPCTVGLLRTVDELTAASALLAEVWRVPVRESPGPINILRALVDTGGYVAGAWSGSRDGGVLVGASFGFTHLTPTGWELRSQVTGTTSIGTGVGTAMKLHQRDWAAAQRLSAVTWTFDPFVHRNAAFNLVRLGGTIVRFVENFYGPLHDGVNGTDETDRVVVRWPVDAPRRHADELRATPASTVLALGVDGLPVEPVGAGAGSGDRADLGPATRRIEVPNAPVASELRPAWLAAVRRSMSAALDAGLVGSGFVDGAYLFRDR
jgi:predicted GNAT superfamily acetyltransferase